MIANIYRISRPSVIKHLNAAMYMLSTASGIKQMWSNCGVVRRVNLHIQINKVNARNINRKVKYRVKVSLQTRLIEGMIHIKLI